ncbi:MAG: OmpA family protein, partial [Bacteroidota bacterium]
MKISIKIMLLLLLVSTGGKAQTIQKTTVYFDFDKAELTTETTHKLDSMAKFINKYIAKVIKIEIAGHTDSMGMNDYNDRLSNLRANAVNDYLLAKKIPDTLIKKVDAFGKRMPVSNNHDSVERSKNRRVEIATYFVKNNAAKTTPQPKNDRKDGYIPHKTFNPKLEDLDKIPDIDSGTTIVIPNLIFVGGSHELVSSSTTALVKIYKLMKENPNLKIELQGHVCCH